MSLVDKMSKGLKRLALVSACLVPWYIASPGEDLPDNYQKYQLPEQIQVQEAEYTDLEGRLQEITKGKLDPKSIDFSEDFEIKTKRYTLERDEDLILSKPIGHVLSIPGKVLFMDWDISWGLDEERSKAVLSILEENKEIKDLTVRINHTAVFRDFMRLYTDDHLTERNNLLSRLVLGPLTAISQVMGELRRGDHYSPMTRTAIVYSNVESIPAHEIGHHMDYDRFESDWEYSLAGYFPPVKLYKEARASLFADDIMDEEDHWQFYRYLVPAFITYLMGGYLVSRRFVRRMNKYKVTGDAEALTDEEKESGRFDPHPLQSFRFMLTSNAALYGGIGAYALANSNNLPELLMYGAFAGGMLATNYVANSLTKPLIPYDHQI